HVGLVPLVLVGFAALTRRPARARGALIGVSAALVVLGVVVAMGMYTPVYGWLEHVPGFSRMRWPAKGLQLAAIGLPVIAAFGLDALLARRETSRGRVDVASAATLVAWALAALALLAAGGPRLFAWLAGGSLPAAAGDAAAQVADLHRSVLFLLLGV